MAGGHIQAATKWQFADIFKCIFVKEKINFEWDFTELCSWGSIENKSTLIHGLMSIRWQAITWTNEELVTWYIYASSCLSGLSQVKFYHLALSSHHWLHQNTSKSHGCTALDCHPLGWTFRWAPVQDDSLQRRHNGCDSVSNHQPHKLFTQPFIWAQIKENIKALRHWPLCGEFTGDRWILRTNDQ